MAVTTGKAIRRAGPSSSGKDSQAAVHIPTLAEENGVLWTDEMRRLVIPRRGGVGPNISRLASAAKSRKVVLDNLRSKTSMLAKVEKNQPKVHAAIVRASRAVELEGRLDAEDGAILLTWLRSRLWDTKQRFSYDGERRAIVDWLTRHGGHAFAVDILLRSINKRFSENDTKLLPEKFKESYEYYSDSFPQNGALNGLERMRQLLVLANEQDYRAARDAAQALRKSHSKTRRIASSFLFPTEQSWVLEDSPLLGTNDGSYWLLASVQSPEVAREVIGMASANGRSFHIGRDGGKRLLPTIVDGLGVKSLGLLNVPRRSVLDFWRADDRKFWFRLRAMIGSDAAIRGLLKHIEKPEAYWTLMSASANQPRRVMRLAAVVAAEPGKKGELANALLEYCIRQFPAIADELRDHRVPILAESIERLRAQAAPAPDSDLPEVLVAPPWRSEAKHRKPQVIPDLVIEGPAPALAWEEGERDAFSAMDLWGSKRKHRDAIVKQGVKALPKLIEALDHSKNDTLPLLVPVSAKEVAMPMASALHSVHLRAIAKAWLLRHPEAAAVGLIPVALGEPGADRNQAQLALRFLVRNGHDKAIWHVARQASVEEALNAELLGSPLARYPQRIRPIPDFAAAATMPAIRLKDQDTVLPTHAVEALLEMLAFSSLDDPYPGIEIVKETCEAASLTEVAWKLFTQWLACGMPPQEKFCLDALGYFGDDKIARELTGHAPRWALSNKTHRAFDVLEVLGAIGSDIAMVQINRLALKSKSTSLREKATAKIRELARVRGLTLEELGDRLAPDLGLELDGSLTLDFGSRKFLVGFDEALRPLIRDEQGKQLKALPRAGKQDDAAKAKEARRRWSDLKKDARQSASMQVERMENAMVAQRRFSPDVFRDLFVNHPLLIHVVRRLVWATYDAGSGKLEQTFRVAEDRTFADELDEIFELPKDAKIGIPHRLEAAPWDKWAGVFADYELAQPFQQIGRPVFLMDTNQAKAKELNFGEGIVFKTAGAYRLLNNGWTQNIGNAGWVWSLSKQITPTVSAVISLGLGDEFGLHSVKYESRPYQCVERLRLPEAQFGKLDPIAFSELVLEIERLRP